MAQRLFTIIEEKQSNVAVAADVTTKAELLALADAVGAEICILKTHIDIITDFDWDLIVQLKQLAQKHNFLLCEDRKFADIGNTVQAQYTGGIYRIAEWADIIIAHGIFGIDSIIALGTNEHFKKCGVLLVAQSSAAHNLITQMYTQAVIEMALAYPDCVIGFIAQEKCTDDARFIHATPGIHHYASCDAYDQQYNTPEHVIKHKKSDIIIVGRGIYQSNDPKTAAQDYRKRAWHAYQESLDNS